MLKLSQIDHQLLNLVEIEVPALHDQLGQIHIQDLCLRVSKRVDIKVLYHSGDTVVRKLVQDLHAELTQRGFKIDSRPPSGLIVNDTLSSIDRASCVFICLTKAVVDGLINPHVEFVRDEDFVQFCHTVCHKSPKKIVLVALSSAEEYISCKINYLKAVFGMNCCHNGAHIVDNIIFVEGDAELGFDFTSVVDRAHAAIWKPIKQIVREECEKQGAGVDLNTLESADINVSTEPALPDVVLRQLESLADSLADRSLVYHAHAIIIEIDSLVHYDHRPRSGSHRLAHPQHLSAASSHTFTPHEKLRARYHRSNSLIAIGKYREASSLLEECFAECTHVWGPDSVYGVCVEVALAEALGGEGLWNRAIPHYKHAVASLESRRPLLPQHDELYVHAVAGLLCALSLAHLRGSAQPMLSLLKQLLAESPLLSSSVEPSFFKFHRGLAYQQLAVGEFFERRYKDAEQTLHKALKLLKGPAGETKDYFLAMHNLGVVMEAQGVYYRALECYEESRQNLLHLLGESHPQYLMCLHSLCVFLYAQYRYEEALPLFRRCLELRTAVLGREHRDTLACLNNVANCLACMHRVADAVALLQDCASLEQDVLGLDHGDLGITLSNLANCLYAEGKLQEAAAVFHQCLPMLENAFSKTNAHAVHVVEKLRMIENKLQTGAV